MESAAEAEGVVVVVVEEEVVEEEEERRDGIDVSVIVGTVKGFNSDISLPSPPPPITANLPLLFLLVACASVSLSSGFAFFDAAGVKSVELRK